MLHTQLGKPDNGFNYIEPGMQAVVVENKRILNFFDDINPNTLSIDHLRKIFSLMIKEGVILYIPEGIFFNESPYPFVKALIDSELEFFINTDNIILLSAINLAVSEKLTVEKVLIIDTHNFYHRNYHALPAMYDDQKRPTTLLKALSNLLKWIASTDYSHVVFTSEGLGSVRIDYSSKELGAESAYKANRSPHDIELLQQIEYCEDFLVNIGFPIIRKNGFEADDMIASVATEFINKYQAIVHCLTSDKDMYQLYTLPGYSNIDIRTHKVIPEEFYFERFGVGPDKFLEYQSLVGDTSDNVFGIKGIGKISAVKLIEQFGTLKQMFDNTSDIKAKGVREKVENGKKSAEISYKLVFARRNLLKDLNLFSLSRKFYDFESIAKVNFKQFLINY